jgi:hypothetical protein
MSDNDAIAIDFETFYSSKLKYSLKTSIAETYCRNPLFDAYIVSACDGANCWAGHPRDFNWNALDGKILLSHNSYFDSTVYSELVRRSLVPKVNFKAWHCSANLTSYLCNRRALDHAVMYLLNVRLDKSSRDTANGKHWPADFSIAEQAEMLAYARRDVYYCHKLWTKFSHLWPEHERRLSAQTITQGQRGVQIDTELLDRYLEQSHSMKLATEKLLPWLEDKWDDEDEFNQKPTSTKCIAEQCRRSGIPCPPVKADEGEEAYQEWETEYGPRHPWIPALTSWRSINKLYKSFLTVKERLRSDATLPFSLKFFGSHTGRWSGDAKLNFQNFRKKPIYCNEYGLMETNENRIPGDWVRCSIDFRNLIISRPGKRMIISDLSQIEPRVLAWLAGDKAFLDLIATGMSPYEAHSRTTMGWTGGNLKKENPDLYNLAKIRVLALGFGAGWRKFIIMAAAAGIDVTAGDPEWITEVLPDGSEKQVSGLGTNARKIVAGYREQNPKIPALWKKLDEAFKRSIGSDFKMTLPSGRVMKYDKVRCEARIEQDEDGKPRRRTVFTAEIGGRRFPIYGGMLTENAVQATARDIFAFHLLELEREGLTVLFSCHDEAILEIDIDNPIKADDVARIMSRCPEWMPGLPVAAEAKEVTRYEK